MSESKDILEGFNAGYIIKQNRPVVFKQLVKSLKDVDRPFYNAFEEGGKEYTQDRIRELMTKDSIPNMDNNLISSKNTPEKDDPDIELE